MEMQCGYLLQPGFLQGLQGCICSGADTPFPLLPLLHSLAWLPEGLCALLGAGCVWHSLFLTEAALAAPSLLPEPGQGYLVQCIIWSDMRGSRNRREDESQSWQKHSMALQCLHQTCG